MDEYASLPDDLIGSSKRWQEWMELERPEDEPLPGTKFSLAAKSHLAWAAAPQQSKAIAFANPTKVT